MSNWDSNRLNDLNDLAMEVFPEDLVKETKDLEELIMAAGAMIGVQRAELAALRHQLDLWRQGWRE